MNNAKIAQIAARLTAMGLSPAAANIVANNAPCSHEWCRNAESQYVCRHCGEPYATPRSPK